MTDLQLLISVLVMAAATMLTRFLPFILFPEHKPVPKVITMLADRLPYASLGMLLVYALKDVQVTQSPFGLYEGLSLGLIAIVHHFKNNTLLSIGSGLGLYLILINLL